MTSSSALIAVTSREVVWLFPEQLGFKFVPVLHRLQGRLAELVELMLARRSTLAQAEEAIGELFSVVREYGSDAYWASPLQIAQKAARIPVNKHWADVAHNAKET